MRGQGNEMVIKNSSNVRSAIRIAEAHVTEHFSKSVGLVARNTRWRRAAASKRQLKVLQNKNIEVPQDLTKGQASHLISMLT